MKSFQRASTFGKGMLGSLKKSKDRNPEAVAEAAANSSEPPETKARDNVKAFIQSGGNVKGDEILFLPTIVEAAESSPAAAAECANVISKFLSKEYYSRPAWQYNALMILRILVDNPGKSFTQNLDEKFVETIRKLLKHSRDSRARQLLMEALDDFEHTKMDDENLKPLVELWKREKTEAFKKFGQPPPPPQPPRPRQGHSQSQNYFSRSHHIKSLPEAAELASRLEEARNSAKLLEQVVMNTPPAQFLDDDLVKEFADRCLSASRSIQGYMVCENPAPDNETMETLIDTNEQLQAALNQHQRARLNARKQLGLGEPDQGAEEPVATNGNHNRVLAWQQEQAAIYSQENVGGSGNGKGKEVETPEASAPGPSASASGLLKEVDRDDPNDSGLEDPFRDPQPEEDKGQRHMYEPFNPGFKPSQHDAGPAGRLDTNVGAAPNSSLQPGRAVDVDNASDGDLYDATPRGKEPVYRY